MTLNNGTNGNEKRRLVLIGGGHAHVQVIKALNHASRPEYLHVTLIDLSATPTYSGMVPGAVAGMYQPDETLIKLEPLASWAAIDFVQDKVTDIDLIQKEIYVEKADKAIPFDVVSIDIGSASRGLEEIPGAREYSIPTRPIADLVKRFDEVTQQLKKRQEEDGQQSIYAVVVGAGVAGIELSMGVLARWSPIVGKDNIHVTLLDAGGKLLPLESEANRKALKQCLEQRNIHIRHGVKVERLESDHLIMKDSGERLEFSHCLWAAGATSHALASSLQAHGLSTTEQGWIRVNQYLQSLSHSCVFAAGDCCSIEIPGGKSPPKAGVFAVRAGPILIENLTGLLDDIEASKSSSSSLKPYEPQGDFMKLINCGDGKALGFRFGIPIYGKWVMELKDTIDKSFMDLFKEENLPELKKGQSYDTAQYDAGGERPSPMDPSEGAALLQRTDDDVDFRQPWNVIKDMADDESYRKAVLSHIKLYESETVAA
jgi:selenide,water dikinase